MSPGPDDMRGRFRPLASAALLALALPPFRVLPLPFVALIPLAVALGSLELAPGSGRKAALLGLTFGIWFWAIQLSWVPTVVGPRFPWAFPGYLAQVGILAGLAALMAWSTHVLHRARGLPIALAFALAWLAMEWVKAHFPFGLSFPWLGLGISLTSWPEFLGIAEWTGESGVSLWLASVNGLGAASVLALSRGTRRIGFSRSWVALALLALAFAAIPAAIGLGRARTLDLRPGPRIAVVGTNVPRGLRLHPARASAEGLAQALGHLGSLRPGEVDLVILPEATVAVPLDGDSGAPFRTSLGESARRLESFFLVGALGVPRGVRSGTAGSLASPGASLLTNSAFLMDPSGGIVSRTDKVRMTPGMEWGGFASGDPGRTHSTGRHSVGALICYESLFGGLAGSLGRSGATVLANLTSDVWFGSGERGPSSAFLRQHPAHLVMRAVEIRTGVARAANGGFSFLLDPIGRTVSEIVPPEGGMTWSAVSLTGRATFFARFGDLLGPTAFMVSLILGGYSFLEARRQSGTQDPGNPSDGSLHQAPPHA